MSEFKVIKSKEQYREYVSAHKNLWKNPTAENEDTRELLEALIEKWERDTFKHEDTHPIELLKYLMENHNMSPAQLTKELGINKATTSKILSCKKGMSKYVIRKLSLMFKISQEAFNRDYPLEADFVKKPAKKVKNKSVIRKAKPKKAKGRLINA